jgi:hypothetical protein
MKEFLMETTDLGTQFEKISDKATSATQHLRESSQRTRDQLAADAAGAREKATAAADRFKANADGARDRASSHWQDIRDKWQAHVAKVRTSVKERKEQFDADSADADANIAMS